MLSGPYHQNHNIAYFISTERFALLESGSSDVDEESGACVVSFAVVLRNESRRELRDCRKALAAIAIPELARLATRRGASNSVPNTPTPPMAMACPIGCRGVTIRMAPGHFTNEVNEKERLLAPTQTNN